MTSQTFSSFSLLTIISKYPFLPPQHKPSQRRKRRRKREKKENSYPEEKRGGRKKGEGGGGWKKELGGPRTAHGENSRLHSFSINPAL